MIVYRLHIAPNEGQGEGEDCDEWFSSLSVAIKRRSDLVRDNPNMEGHLYGADYQIDKVVLAKLPLKQLALAILNRKEYFIDQTIVVQEYVGPSRRTTPNNNL